MQREVEAEIEMRIRITTQHADYERLFGGQSIVVELALGCATVVEAPKPELIGERIELSEGTPKSAMDQLAAMYSADVEAA